MRDSDRLAKYPSTSTITTSFESKRFQPKIYLGKDKGQRMTNLANRVDVMFQQCCLNFSYFAVAKAFL